MPAGEPAQATEATDTVADRISLDALVVVAARRLVLGVDVAAAKFLSGQQIDDHVREQEILESMASRLKRARPQHSLGMEFVRDQIEANKVIQRGLHRYWAEHPTALRQLGELRRDTAAVALRSLYSVLSAESCPPRR